MATEMVRFVPELLILLRERGHRQIIWVDIFGAFDMREALYDELERFWKSGESIYVCGIYNRAQNSRNPWRCVI